MSVYIDENGDEHDALEYILNDGGDAPGSYYGTRCEDWAPAAVALFDLYVASSAEGSIHELESAISLVVNAHEPIEGLEDYES